MIGIMILPLPCMVISGITGWVSYFRVREDRQLTGAGWRVVGQCINVLNLFFWMWMWGLIGNQSLEPLRKALLRQLFSE